MTNLAPPGLLEKILAAGQADPTVVLWILFLMFLARAAYRLLAEWQRRLTLDRILSVAPQGSVIIQKKGKAGPAMWIWVGLGARPTLAAPERVYIFVQSAAVLPPGSGRR